MSYTLVMKVADSEAHVSLGGDNVQAGDRLDIFRYFCPGYEPGSPEQARLDVRCGKKHIGQGVVSQVLNGRYSVMQITDKTRVKEGDVVEVVGEE